MLTRGVIAWAAEPRGADAARAFVGLAVISLPLMIVSAPAGIILADICLIFGCVAGVLAKVLAGEALSVPRWLWWAGALLLPYGLSLLIGPGLWLMPGYAGALVKHMYAPLFALALVFVAELLWGSQSSDVLYRYLAVSGLLVVVSDTLIVLLALSGIFVFVPAFRDGVYPSRLVWPFALPSQLPGFLLMTFPLSVMWLFRKMERRVGVELAGVGTLVVALMHVLAIVVSGSRAGLIGLLLEVAGVVTLIYWQVPRKKWALLTLLLGACTALAVLGLLALGKSNWVIQRALLAISDALAGGQTGGGADFRAYNWEFAQRQFLGSPLFGAGLSSSIADFGFEVHNTFLAAFAELGSLGGAAVAGLLLGVPSVALWRWLRGHKDVGHDRIPVLAISMFGSATFAATHYVLRQRWVWLGTILVLSLLARSRTAESSDEAGRLP